MVYEMVPEGRVSLMDWPIFLNWVKRIINKSL